jgi:hypothetical protein
MTDLLTASPSVGSWFHSPMTIAEIDAHPDADRIWATIEAMQNHVENEIERREEVIREDAADDERDKCRSNLSDAITMLLEQEQVSESLAQKIRALEKAI